MSVKSNINDRIEQAKAFAEKLRKVYRDAYEKAVEATTERVDGIRKVGDHLDADAVREVIATKVQAAHKIVDDLNKTLADKAVPAFRKRDNPSSVASQDGKGAQVGEKKEPHKEAIPVKKTRAKKVPRDSGSDSANKSKGSATNKSASASATKARAPKKRRASNKKQDSSDTEKN
jgi:hypothetical protein